MISRAKVRREVLVSWGFTLMGLFNIGVLCCIAAFLALRFGGPAALEGLVMPLIAFGFLMVLLSEVVVNILMRARIPDPVKDKRFLEALARVRRKSRMFIKPRARIVSIGGKPNAMAYGLGFPGFAAIGVSRELVDMLDDKELEAVLAHECAHIKCRDTGILALIGFLLGVLNKLRNVLSLHRSLILQSPIAMAVGWIIYGLGRVAFYISRFSITQERELAADALGAWYVRDPRPLISALKKLHAWSSRESEGNGPSDSIFKDLMLSHPGLEERIERLEALVAGKTTKEGIVQ